MFSKTRSRRCTLAASAVAATALLALPAGAAAEKWNGVVVAKDRTRGTVVTATPAGDVRTVRLSARAVKKSRAGRRVAVDAAPLADGTYQGTRLAVRGRSSRATVRGVVVETRGRRLYIAAGDSVLTVRTASRRRARAASADTIATGDVVAADVTLTADGIQAAEVVDVGDVSILELEGIVLDLTAGVLRVAVARRGEVQIAVPEGALVSAPVAGDQVEAAVSVAEDGSMTLIALDVEDDARDDDDEDDHDHGLEVDDDGEVKAEGILAAVSPESVSIQIGLQAVTCAIPPGAVLSGFAVGDEVEAECELVDGALVLRALESENVEFEVTDDGGFKLEDERTDAEHGDDDSDEGDEDEEDEEDEEDDEGDEDDEDDEDEEDEDE